MELWEEDMTLRLSQWVSVLLEAGLLSVLSWSLAVCFLSLNQALWGRLAREKGSRIISQLRKLGQERLGEGHASPDSAMLIPGPGWGG